MSADPADLEMFAARNRERWNALSPEAQLVRLREDLETFESLSGCEEIAAMYRAELAKRDAPGGV